MDCSKIVSGLDGGLRNAELARLRRAIRAFADSATHAREMRDDFCDQAQRDLRKHRDPVRLAATIVGWTTELDGGVADPGTLSK